MKMMAVISRVCARRGIECVHQVRNMPARIAQPCIMYQENENMEVESNKEGIRKPFLLLWHELGKPSMPYNLI